MRRLAFVFCLSLVASACAGPSARFEIGSKEVPADILLGRTPAPRPPAANPGPIGFPGFVQPPIPRPRPGVNPTSPPAAACPIADPFDSPLLVARLSAPRPPVPATYAFRNQGTFQVGGVAPSDYPPIVERAVGNVQPLEDDGNYAYDVSIAMLGETTTTTYVVLNEGLDRGVYITRIVTSSARGVDVFEPNTMILLLPFPPPEFGTNLEDELEAVRGREYRSAGTDPLTQTTMTLEARVADTKTRVDACGDWVDGFEVEVLSGRIAGPRRQIEFTGRIVIAPQYGALIVEDELRVEGRESLQEVESFLRARINRVPIEPR